MSYLVVQSSMSKICYRLLLLKTPLSGREFQMFYSSEVLFMQKGRNFFKFLTKTEKRKAERFSKSCYVQQGENTGEKMLCVYLS